MIKSGDMVKIKPAALEATGYPFSHEREWKVGMVYDDGRYFLGPRQGRTGYHPPGDDGLGPFKESDLIPLGPPMYPFEDQLVEMAHEYLGDDIANANKYRVSCFKLAEMIMEEMFIAEFAYPMGEVGCTKKLDKCIIATLLDHMNKGNFFPLRGPRINNFNDLMNFPWHEWHKR